MNRQGQLLRVMLMKFPWQILHVSTSNHFALLNTTTIYSEDGLHSGWKIYYNYIQYFMEFKYCSAMYSSVMRFYKVPVDISQPLFCSLATNYLGDLLWPPNTTVLYKFVIYTNATNQLALVTSDHGGGGGDTPRKLYYQALYLKPYRAKAINKPNLTEKRELDLLLPAVRGCMDIRCGFRISV